MRNTGILYFTDGQMEWLHLFKDYIAASLCIELDDLRLNPFDRKGDPERLYEMFEDSYETILIEMNNELVV